MVKVIELTDDLLIEFSPAESLEIQGLDTLKVMADSLRMQIVDFLRQDSATVKEIAAMMRVSPKSLYYHVNLLEKHGLIRVVGTRIVSGILEKRYRATAYLFNFNEFAHSPDTSDEEAALEAFSSLFAITRDEVRIALETGMIDMSDAAPAAASLNVDWNLLNLSSAALDEMLQRIRTLIQEHDSEGPASVGEGTYRLFMTVFPAYRRGERPEIPPLNLSTGERS